MLHRMTTLLSTVVLFLAAVVLTAVFPTTAWAADGCLAEPTGNPQNGSRWYYQTNRVTHQKCWVLGAKKVTVRSIALQRSANLRSSNELAERTTAVSCIKAPNSQPTQGKRWYYRTDKATGQRCWHLGTQVSKIGNAIPARSPAAVKLVAPKTPAAVLPPATADASARSLDALVAPFRQIETASSPGSVTEEVTNENLATSTFASRWIDLSNSDRSRDRQPGLAGNSEAHQRIAAVFDDVTNSTKASDRLFIGGPSLNITLIVFLMWLGGALILYGLIGASFLHERSLNVRSAPPARSNPQPLKLPSIEIAPNSIRTNANRKRIVEVL
jgi:hypothetical protein